MILFIIVEFSEYNLGLMEYKDALDFWNWIDEQGKIGGIYTKLKYIFEHLSKYEKSRIITKDQLQKLRTYNYFPIDIVNNRNDHGKYWMESLIDDITNNQTETSYYNEYQWYIDLRKYFILYINK